MTPSAVLRLEVPNDILRARIDLRAKDMWPNLLAEVRTLVPSRFRGDEHGFTSLGYREAVAVLHGTLSDADGFTALLRATHAYAKRQRTWFRHQLDALTLIPDSSSEKTLALALAALEATREKISA